MKLAVFNKGTQSIPEAYFELAGFKLEPQIIKNIKPDSIKELAFVLPDNHSLTKDDTINLTVSTSDSRQFE